VSLWSVERNRGSAYEFHARDLPIPAERTVWFFEVTGPALALGSTQSLDDVDTEAADEANISVFNRHSGGGAVLLEATGSVWIDVVIPNTDPLWNDDVALATHWLGQVWLDTLDDLGVDDASMHVGSLAATPMSPVLCFAGVGPGEILVGGNKVIGISQRRTRDAARFQCSVLLDWDPELHARLLGPGLDRVNGSVPAAEAIAALAVRPLRGLGPDAILAAFVGRLPK
jgi:lipoate-protein ligase A